VKNKYWQGILFASVNMVGLSTVGLVDKIGSIHTPSPFLYSAQSVFYSLFFTLLFSLLFFRKTFVHELKSIPPSSFTVIILIGILSSGLFIVFRFLGLTQSTGTFATLSQVITTALTAILAYFFLHEELSKRFWLLFLIILVSTYFVSIGKFALTDIKMGDLFILCGSVLLAIGNVLSRLTVKSTSPVIVSVGRFLIGYLFLLIVGLIIFGHGADFFYFNYIAVLSGFLWSVMILSFNFAIKNIGVTITTTLLMIAPIITMVLEYTILHQSFTGIQILAACLTVICGLLMIQKTRHILRY
jgi:drug/metabolite transporter (DMT)-like permease